MYRNMEGYPDPTAGKALAKIEREERLRRELRGMTQKEFYKSQAWRRTRKAYIDYRIALDGGVCEVCRQELGRVVHHKIWLNDKNCSDPDISLSFKNLRYECQTCHNKEKDPSRKAPGRVAYGPNGEVLKRGKE